MEIREEYLIGCPSLRDRRPHGMSAIGELRGEGANRRGDIRSGRVIVSNSIARERRKAGTRLERGLPSGLHKLCWISDQRPAQALPFFGAAERSCGECNQPRRHGQQSRSAPFART